jgi:hypothetical protein
MFPFWGKQKVYLLLHLLKLKNQIKWYPMWYPSDIFSVRRQKTPQEEGF